MAETSRQRWVRQTRQSVHRALARDYAASADGLEGNLDVNDYVSGLGFTGVRSVREIQAALRWLEQQGLAERADLDGDGALYQLTEAGAASVPPKAEEER